MVLIALVPGHFLPSCSVLGIMLRAHAIYEFNLIQFFIQNAKYYFRYNQQHKALDFDHGNGTTMGGNLIECIEQFYIF